MWACNMFFEDLNLRQTDATVYYTNCCTIDYVQSKFSYKPFTLIPRPGSNCIFIPAAILRNPNSLQLNISKYDQYNAGVTGQE